MVIKPTPTRLARILFALHIPNSISREIVSEITTWTEKSGPEWTVDRLKALKTDFIRITAGLDRSSEWVEYKGGFPVGAFGRLFRYGSLDNKRLIRVLNACMSYTSFLATKETTKQLSKFYTSVAADPLGSNVVDEVFACIQPEAEKLQVLYHKLRTVKDYIPNPSKRAPTSEGRSVPENEWLSTTDCLWKTSIGRKLYSRYSQVREVVRPIEGYLKPKLRKLPPYFYSKVSENINERLGFVGKIGHIQEPGMKLRAVANPFRVYQLALSRLGDQLYELIQTLPWDCTHDQQDGTEWAERKLSAHNKMFAVDLSDATNQFPLELQLKVLHSIKGIKEEDIHLFEDLSKANWLSPSHGIINWTKGQPLGLYPSFAAFALTHGILVSSLAKSKGLDPTDTFRILGDDIVISDQDLYNSYREVLAKLAVPVSESKTLQSDLVTEFGGRVIVPGSIITLGKWRMSSDRNFLDLLRNIGPRYLKYLQPRQQKVAEILLTLPKPVGFSMNPLGLPAIERWRIEEAFSYLYESELDLPHFLKTNFYAQVLTTPSFTKSMFIRHRGPFPRPYGANNPRQGIFKDEDVLVNVSNVTGVQIQPSLQLSGLANQNIDVLERIYKIANKLSMRMGSQAGDPRGLSELELWEKRIKRENFSRCNSTQEDLLDTTVIRS